jgi:putative transposase
MSTRKGYRFKLRCSPAQERALRRFSGGLRWVWNRALAEQQARHERGEPYAGFSQMCKWLTVWRNDPATGWLAEGPIHPQQQVLRRLDESYKRFFKKAGGFPKFAKRGHESCIRFPDPKQFELDQVNGRVKLPKLGWLRIRQSQPVAGVLKNVSIRREGALWYCSIQVEVAEVAQALDIAPSIGLDMGIANFLATSEGALQPPLAALAGQQRRLKRYQRSVSRKVKGSCNRRKAVARLANLHRRIARQRSDWLHKLSSKLVKNHPVIAIEDLKVAAMSASARGTIEAPGKNVKAKAGLNRNILDAAWSEFRRQLEYKSALAGGEVIAVPPAYTSQCCGCCGYVDSQNRKRQDQFVCLACGHAEHADTNAAKNILAAGHAVWSSRLNERTKACGEDVRCRETASLKQDPSKKQEPPKMFVPAC